MMTSRTIGYHEKNEKHRTAPMRKAHAEAFRRTRGMMWRLAAGGRTGAYRGFEATLTMASSLMPGAG